MNNRLTKQPHPGVNILRRLLGMPQKQQTKAEWWQWYKEYLQSPEWQRRADRCKRQAGYKCEECGATDTTLHAHHLTYKNVGNERASELKCLCEGCHREEHKE